MDWTFYDAALAGKPVVANLNDPQIGFYRRATRGKGIEERFMRFVPIAIYDDVGVLACREGDTDVTQDRCIELWNQGCHANPITEEWYRAVEQGEAWPDLHPLVSAFIGHNRPPEEEGFEYLKAQIEELHRDAQKQLSGPPLANQADADAISDLSSYLQQLYKQADQKRAEEKRPHDEASKSVQAKWRPLLHEAEIYTDLKIKLLTPWHKQRVAEQRDSFDDADEKVTSGTRGRAQSLKTVGYEVKIVDRDAAWSYFRDGPAALKFLTEQTEKAVRHGDITVPGTEVKEIIRVV